MRGDVTNVVNVSSFAEQPLIVWKLKSSVDREDSKARDPKKPQKDKKNMRAHFSKKKNTDTESQKF